MNNSNKNWQGELRRKLEREAFNEKYSCLICKRKENLHIHHLIYSEDKNSYFDPRYWRILCDECHGIQRTKKNKIFPKIESSILRQQSIKYPKKEIEIIDYSIPCENCGEIFLSENPSNRFCINCLCSWMGRFRNYYEIHPEKDVR